MQFSNGALAAILTNLLTNPKSREIDSMDGFSNFCTALAQLVCDHCGGAIKSPAEFVASEHAVDFTRAYQFEIELNESSPDGGGVWAEAELEQVIRGYFGYEGTILNPEFVVPKGAGKTQRDAAFVDALSQLADIDYVVIGERKAS